MKRPERNQLGAGLVLVLALFTAGSATADTVSEKSDRVHRLLVDCGTEIVGLRIYQHHQIVIVRGMVDRAEDARAIRQTLHRSGITRVANLIEVAPRVDDDQLRRKVERALFLSSSLEGTDLRLSVHDGRIHLSGVVRNENQTRAAIALIRSVEGVIGVDSTVVTGRADG